MAIQVTIDDARNITLDDLVSLVPNSTAAKQLNTLRDRLTCMCGSDVDQHTQGDGHQPVSMYDYKLDELRKEREKLDMWDFEEAIWFAFLIVLAIGVSIGWLLFA